MAVVFSLYSCIKRPLKRKQGWALGKAFMDNAMETMNMPKRRALFVLVQFFTLVRIPIAILLVVLLLQSERVSYGLVFLGCCLIGIIELSDLLDGMIARRYGFVTEWGAMLDPFSDSISRLLIYWGLSMAGLALPLVPLTMALRDITVAYCRITMSRFGKTVSAKRSGKIKAIVQGVGAVIIILGPLYWPYTGKWIIPVLSWIVIAVTAFSVIEYAAGAVAAARERKR
jgi:CDP-diacylglycerol---glycerol-3-phosphate 3-phosphatidyltransferase